MTDYAATIISTDEDATVLAWPGVYGGAGDIATVGGKRYRIDLVAGRQRGPDGTMETRGISRSDSALAADEERALVARINSRRAADTDRY